MALAPRMIVAMSEGLQDLLESARPGLSLDALDGEAKRKGIAVSRNTIAKARRGELGPRTTEPVLLALAQLYGLDVRQVRVAVGRPPGELGPYVPDERAALAWAHNLDEAADELWVDVETLEVRLAHLHPSERHYLRRRLQHDD